MSESNGQGPTAGWYDDPAGSGGLRWWDGGEWTDHIQPAAPQTTTPGAETPNGTTPDATTPDAGSSGATSDPGSDSAIDDLETTRLTPPSAAAPATETSEASGDSTPAVDAPAAPAETTTDAWAPASTAPATAEPSTPEPAAAEPDTSVPATAEPTDAPAPPAPVTTPVQSASSESRPPQPAFPLPEPAQPVTPPSAPPGGYPQAGPPHPGYPQAGQPHPGYPQSSQAHPGYPAQTPQQNQPHPGYPQPGQQQPGIPQPGGAQQQYAYPSAPAYGGYPATEPRKVGPETPVYGPFIWVIVLLPLLSLLLLPLSFTGLEDSMRYDIDSYGTYSSGASGGALLAQGIATVFGWLLYGAGVVLAYFDRKWLLSKGFDRPFHWAWGFLSAVYPIGRSVVVRRRSGRGIAPMWVTIGVIALNIVIAIGVVVWVVGLSVSMFNTGGYTY
ncbi:DUF2510 domain-containing protein [Herbiconiux sp. P18]|uniref:DUF2510 domain-containing protein n=1 Tax=Herbiconiux liangxiaofengii TaxID=3342795 RepID=UPI0035B96320